MKHTRDRSRHVGFRLVNRSGIELVKASDVVDVSVRRHGEQIGFEEVGRGFIQAGQTEAGVDQKVTVPPPHMPNVAPQKWVDKRLGQKCDCVVNAFAMEPVLGDRQVDAVHPTSVRGPLRATRRRGWPRRCARTTSG